MHSYLTRWGTYIAMLTRVWDYRLPLEEVVTPGLKSTIQNPLFQQQLYEAIAILEPILERLRMTEADSYQVGQVLEAWESIYQHLRQHMQKRPELAEFLQAKFRNRFERQTANLHFVAYFALSQNTSKRGFYQLDDYEVKERVGQGFADYGVGEEAIREFLSF